MLVFGACANIRYNKSPAARSGCQYLVGWEERPHTQSAKSPIRMPKSGKCASQSSGFSRRSRENGPWMLAMTYGVWPRRASLMAWAWHPMEGGLETYLDMELL